MTNFAQRFDPPRGLRDVLIKDRMRHVVLQRLLGVKPRDIAAMLGCSLCIVRSDLHRCGWTVGERDHWQYGGYMAWSKRLEVLGIDHEVIRAAGAVDCPSVGWWQSADMPEEMPQAWLERRARLMARGRRRRAWWAKRRARMISQRKTAAPC